MAVPDWPTTYGYNLFLYPWQTWWFGPWDLLIEHGHRLLGAIVGVLTILTVVSIVICDTRRWVQFLAFAALLAVIAQGVLGGQRVLQDSVFLARLHGCFGPAFFALCVALCLFTSRSWQMDTKWVGIAKTGWLHRLAAATAVAAYVQLVLGSQVRHIVPNASLGSFRTAVLLHVAMAVIVTSLIFCLAAIIVTRYRGRRALTTSAILLSLLVIAQVLLGAGSWIVKYGWPDGLPTISWSETFTVQADAMLPAAIVTGHVAVGSLILALAVTVTILSARYRDTNASSNHLGNHLLGVPA